MKRNNRWINCAIALLFLVIASVGRGAAEPSWILVSDESVQRLWETVDLKTRQKAGAYLIRKLGLSSTGKIELTGFYRWTQDDPMGSKGDRVAHFIQKDLFGSRLFWSCLVNLDRGTIQRLYPVANSPEGKLAAFEKLGSLDDAAPIIGRAEGTELRDSKGKPVPRVVRDENERVTRLILTDMKLSPKEIAEISGLDRLRALVLLRTGFRDEDLAMLADCQHLEHLNLTSTEVTDAAVDTLVKLKGLRTVCLGDVGITPAAIEKLKEQNQNRPSGEALRWGYSQRKE